MISGSLAQLTHWAITTIAGLSCSSYDLVSVQRGVGGGLCGVCVFFGVGGIFFGVEIENL